VSEDAKLRYSEEAKIDVEKVNIRATAAMPMTTRAIKSSMSVSPSSGARLAQGFLRHFNLLIESLK
jgi:hypothetical protein